MRPCWFKGTGIVALGEGQLERGKSGVGGGFVVVAGRQGSRHALALFTICQQSKKQVKQIKQIKN